MNEGIRNINGDYEFDWQNDLPDDILTLRFPKNKVQKRKILGVSLFYFYKTAKTNCPAVKQDFLVWLKGKDNKRTEITNFVQRAVIAFNSFSNLNKYDVVIFPPSKSVVLKRLELFLKARHLSPVYFNDIFVKDTSNIDISGLENLLNNPKTSDSFKSYINRVIKYVNKNQTIELKKIPKILLQYIHNFIVPNPEYSRIEKIIEDANVLVVDDYCFSGTTLIEINKQLLKFNPASITNFCLISK